MKIYLASSWRNPHHSPFLAVLQGHGFDVYNFKKPNEKDPGFSWDEIDWHWKGWDFKKYKDALSHPAANRGFSNDYNAMMQSDICILLLPCGASAHSEAGYMAGMDKRVLVYIPQMDEPELMYKLFTDIYNDLNVLLLDLQEYKLLIDGGHNDNLKKHL